MFSTNYSLSDYCNQKEFEFPDEESHKKIHKMHNKENKWGNDDPTLDIDRIKNALCVRSDGQDIDLETMDRKTLETLARRTNAALIHCSGNCAILANVLAYNVDKGKEIFSVKNIFPIYKGLHPNICTNFIQDKNLDLVTSGVVKFQEVDQILLDYNRNTNRRVYIISMSYPILYGLMDEGHAFNAVVLKNKENQPEIAYVDAWYPSRPIFSSKQLDETYKPTSLRIYALKEPEPPSQDFNLS